MDKLKIVVCGATGNQGGAVVRSLLRDERWHVVALTRSPGSEAAQWLAGLGAEVIRADTADQASVFRAFQGAYGIYAVTQPWDAVAGKYNIEKEIIQAKNIIWASRLVTAKHVVFSTFFNPEGGRTGVGFIDSKLEIERHIREQQLPCTVLRTAVYMENIHIDPDKLNIIRGNYGSETGVPYISLDDIGRAVTNIFNNPEYFMAKCLGLVADYKSGREIADTYSTEFNGSFRYRSASKLMMRLFRPELYNFQIYLNKIGQFSSPEIIEKAISDSKKIFNEIVDITGFLKEENLRREY